MSFTSHLPVPISKSGPFEQVDPLTKKSIGTLYQESCLDEAGVLFLAVIKARGEKEVTLCEGRAFWNYVKKHLSEPLTIPGTDKRVAKVYFYVIDSPRLRSEQNTPKARFLLDADILTAQLAQTFEEVLNDAIFAEMLEAELTQRGNKKEPIKGYGFVKSGGASQAEQPLVSLMDVLLAAGREKIFEGNVLSIHPALHFEKMQRNPAVFYAKQVVEVADLTDEFLLGYAREYHISALRLAEDPEFFHEVPVHPHFLFAQGLFFALHCIERGLPQGGELLRNLLQMDADLLESAGLENFSRENYPALAFLPEGEHLDQVLLAYIKEKCGKDLHLHCLLGMHYYDELPLPIGGEDLIDFERTSEHLSRAAEAGDPEAIYYLASFDLFQYGITDDPDFLAQCWQGIEGLMALAEEEEPHALLEATFASLRGVMDAFQTTTKKEHWPEEATEERIVEVLAMIPNASEE